ncbi:hypothetical protein SLA2020_100310 [Shorea laevis]
MTIKGGDEFRTEMQLLCHQNLVSLIGFCQDERILVYEYLPHGSLRDHLNSSAHHPLPWKRQIEICIGVARALHYLHTGTKYAIIHRDVKSANILLDKPLNPLQFLLRTLVDHQRGFPLWQTADPRTSLVDHQRDS